MVAGGLHASEALSAVCRDCLTLASPTAGPRCGHCGSPRLIVHPERDALCIAHVDCDAFFAAIEKRDHPELADKPVIIGGGRRGVVSTACYIARTYGIRSAMPMFKALAACPHAVVIKPDMEKYIRTGRAVREMMLSLTPLVEPLSIDEAFLDLSGTQALHGASPATVLAGFARRVEEALGITVSIGLAPNKFLAKLASELDKPRGFSVIGRVEAASVLAAKPVGVIFGVGAAMQARLAAHGITLIGDIARRDPAELARAFGAEGLRLHQLARGEDHRSVRPGREAKSISSETTFASDLSRFEELEPILWRLSERIAARLARTDLAGTQITLKLKTSAFVIITRSRVAAEPTRLAIRVFDIGRDLLRPELDGRRFRLIGLGIAGFRPAADADRGDLIDAQTPREVAAARAVDQIRARFGERAMVRGIGLGRETAGASLTSRKARP